MTGAASGTVPARYAGFTRDELGALPPDRAVITALAGCVRAAGAGLDVAGIDLPRPWPGPPARPAQLERSMQAGPEPGCW